MTDYTYTLYIILRVKSYSIIPSTLMISNWSDNSLLNSKFLIFNGFLKNNIFIIIINFSYRYMYNIYNYVHVVDLKFDFNLMTQ